VRSAPCPDNPGDTLVSALENDIFCWARKAILAEKKEKLKPRKTVAAAKGKSHNAVDPRSWKYLLFSSANPHFPVLQLRLSRSPHPDQRACPSYRHREKETQPFRYRGNGIMLPCGFVDLWIVEKRLRALNGCGVGGVRADVRQDEPVLCDFALVHKSSCFGGVPFHLPSWSHRRRPAVAPTGLLKFSTPAPESSATKLDTSCNPALEPNRACFRPGSRAFAMGIRICFFWDVCTATFRMSRPLRCTVHRAQRCAFRFQACIFLV
jgi:hypothetical protein